MTCKRAAATIFLVLALPSAALAQAGTITKGMQNNCVNDYKKFCGDYGLQTAALNLCMKKAGPSLSPACVQALVQAGKVTQADVDKVKAQMKGR
jgi:BarA-like signal transduction histidine kinase